jgi:hypothetical protein
MKEYRMTYANKELEKETKAKYRPLNWEKIQAHRISKIYCECCDKRETINQWKKLEFKKIPSNLNAMLKNNSIEKYAVATEIDSDINLESYSSFAPTKYNYYARKSFTYDENLNYIDRDLNSFVVYNTGVYLEPENPYSNLLNVNFPTVAITQFPKNLISKKQIGHYLLPERLGFSFYLGKGYTSEISNAKIDLIDSLSAERIYYDLNKFNPSNKYKNWEDVINSEKIELKVPSQNPKTP